MAYDLTWDEVGKLPEGSPCGMPCITCEGHEVHIKRNGKWVCQNCGSDDVRA